MNIVESFTAGMVTNILTKPGSSTLGFHNTTVEHVEQAGRRNSGHDANTQGPKPFMLTNFGYFSSLTPYLRPQPPADQTNQGMLVPVAHSNTVNAPSTHHHSGPLHHHNLHQLHASTLQHLHLRVQRPRRACHQHRRHSRNVLGFRKVM